MKKILNVIKKDINSEARLGILSLPHGDVETPAFMPVGTNGTVKGIYHDKIKEMGYGIILGNTYHLYLRPGTEVLSDLKVIQNRMKTCKSQLETLMEWDQLCSSCQDALSNQDTEVLPLRLSLCRWPHR